MFKKLLGGDRESEPVTITFKDGSKLMVEANGQGFQSYNPESNTTETKHVSKWGKLFGFGKDIPEKTAKFFDKHGS